MSVTKLTGRRSMRDLNELWEQNPEFFNCFGTTEIEKNGTVLTVANWMVDDMSPAKDQNGNQWLALRNMIKGGFSKFYKKTDIDHGYGFSIFGCLINDMNSFEEEADDVLGEIYVESEFANRAYNLTPVEVMRCAADPAAVSEFATKLGQEIGCDVSFSEEDGIWSLVVPGMYQFIADDECNKYALRRKYGIRRYCSKSREKEPWLTKTSGYDAHVLEHGMCFRLSCLGAFLAEHEHQLDRTRSIMANPTQYLTVTKPHIPETELDPWHFRIPKYGALVYTGRCQNHEGVQPICAVCNQETGLFTVYESDDPLDFAVKRLAVRIEPDQSLRNISTIYDDIKDLDTIYEEDFECTLD